MHKVHVPNIMAVPLVPLNEKSVAHQSHEESSSRDHECLHFIVIYPRVEIFQYAPKIYISRLYVYIQSYGYVDVYTKWHESL